MTKLAIFRIPDDNEPNAFVEFDIDQDGMLVDPGGVFYIEDPEDTYTKMGFDQLAIADKIDGGSNNAHSITIKNNNGTPTVVCDFSLEELQYYVNILLAHLTTKE